MRSDTPLAPVAREMKRGSIETSARLPAMAFGQQSGPPASSRQVQELLTLLKDAGHADFRDARGPMGFTQRQAAGKFTRDEATGFIDQLQDSQWREAQPEKLQQEKLQPENTESRAEHDSAVPAQRLDDDEQLIRRIPTAELAEELRRRGWTVEEP